VVRGSKKLFLFKKMLDKQVRCARLGGVAMSEAASHASAPFVSSLWRRGHAQNSRAPACYLRGLFCVLKAELIEDRPQISRAGDLRS
jgi:hypothetical protein